MPELWSRTRLLQNCLREMSQKHLLLLNDSILVLQEAMRKERVERFGHALDLNYFGEVKKFISIREPDTTRPVGQTQTLPHIP
jgi:hypothetical protein